MKRTCVFNSVVNKSGHKIQNSPIKMAHANDFYLACEQLLMSMHKMRNISPNLRFIFSIIAYIIYDTTSHQRLYKYKFPI